MHEITQEARTLAQLETEIKAHSRYVTASIIAIGQALIEAKAQLNHGEWGEWLRDKVQFSQSTANNFMRVAREIRVQSGLAALPYTKVLALLDVPREERETFAKENGAEDLSTAELRRAIKERKAAEARAAAAESKLESLRHDADIERARAERAGTVADELNAHIVRLEGELNAAKAREPKIITEVVREEHVPADYEDMKRRAAEAEEMAARAEAAEKWAMDAEEKLKTAQREVQRAKMTRLDDGGRMNAEPMSLEAFENGCKALLGPLAAAPHMGSYFAAQNAGTVAAYTALTEAVLVWAEGTMAVLHRAAQTGCIPAEGGRVQ